MSVPSEGLAMTFDDEESKSTIQLAVSMEINRWDELKRPSLTVMTGARFGELFNLSGDEYVIGRSSRCNICLEDASISRQHARVFHQQGNYFLEDLKSSNGTYLNGERTDPSIPLREGDKITLGKLTILRFTFSDAFDEAFQRRIYQAALRDGLTQAYNKRYLLERLEMELSYAQRTQEYLSVLFLDIDHFKRVNDQYGHIVGDRVLVELTDRIQDLVRQEDIFGRYGGEEFAIVCRNTSTERALLIAERVCKIVSTSPFVYRGDTIPITVSVGVATFPDVAASSSQQILAAADTALYAAKKAGRNCVRAYA